jgi:hypothetical protein
MPLKKSDGNMYPWVTHMHAELGGECSHKCSYCYVNNVRWGRAPRYCGEVRLIEAETKTRFGTGKVIFKEHMNDLFAVGVPDETIVKIIDHCHQWPDNTYVFQTKNPARYFTRNCFPEKSIFGTTIETNRDIPAEISTAPQPQSRASAMASLRADKFITIEPVMDFDVDILAGWIANINPKFLNLGADSKNHNLPEPTVDKIFALVDKLKEYGIELREKHNLARLTRSPSMAKSAPENTSEARLTAYNSRVTQGA